jgi:fructose 1,6-bisphosphate aldolase/phosphatase
VHSFAWDVFQRTTALAQELGLYGAGQDLLSDAFSGNLRGLGPGYAEIEFEQRPSETVLCFLADKTEPGAWNLPLYRMFADPFNTAGLVIDPKMHAGFSFEVHDLFENQRIVFDCPAELYELLLFIGAPSRYVIQSVRSKTLDEPAAATSTQRLALMAGRYVGKDDPVLIVRCQSGLPAVGEVLEPFAFPHTVAGCMRGSHHAPLMPVAVGDAHPSRFDGPPAGYCVSFARRDGAHPVGTPGIGCLRTGRAAAPKRGASSSRAASARSSSGPMAPTKRKGSSTSGAAKRSRSSAT